MTKLSRYILITVLLIATAASADTTITRNGYWRVLVNGEQVSQHAEQDKAFARATNEAQDDPTATIKIEPPTYSISYEPDVTPPAPVDPAPVDPTPEPEPSPNPVDPPVFGPVLTTGNGFPGPTNTPAQVGNSPHNAIARWNVVPEQRLTGPFNAGLLAFHVHGIDRVEFSLDGGPWVSVSEPTLNPRTNTEEYWATIPPVSSPVEVRAIAYPVNGVPRVLEPLVLNHPETVINLPAGEHRIADLQRQLPDKGWLIVRGVGDATVLTGGSQWPEGRLKVQDAAWRPGPGQGMVVGGSKDYNKSWVWLDRVKVIGDGGSTAWTTNNWGRTHVTDSEISEVNTAFHGTAGSLLVRNTDIRDIKEDTFRAFGLVTGVTIDNVDRGDTAKHPDAFEFASGWKQWQVIYHNVKGRNVKSQGFAGANMEDVAFVDVDMEFPGWTAMQVGGNIQHLLMQDVRLIGGARFRGLDPASSGIVLRRVKIGWQEPFLPSGVDHPGVTVE